MINKNEYYELQNELDELDEVGQEMCDVLGVMRERAIEVKARMQEMEAEVGLIIENAKENARSIASAFQECEVSPKDAYLAAVVFIAGYLRATETPISDLSDRITAALLLMDVAAKNAACCEQEAA